MRRISLGGLFTVTVLTLVPFGSSDRRLPLLSPEPATSRLLAIVSDDTGSRLAVVDPLTFASVHASGRVSWYGGWVPSPDRKLLAVAVHPDPNSSASKLLFANTSTLRWVRQGVRLEGYFLSAIWARQRTVVAVSTPCCRPGATVDAVDPATKRVVRSTSVAGTVMATARSADRIVLLTTEPGEIAPATLVVVDADGSVRSVRLDQVLAGTRFDQSGQDPIGATRQPGLAVDPDHEIAFVVDPDDLVAEVRLADLSVAYHRPAKSPLARLADWVSPAAEAKGLNGPTLTARWLGDGLIAVAGTNYTAARNKNGNTDFSGRPAGLQVIDGDDWSSRPLDSQADSVSVADGVLLATGGTWGSDTSGSGEGLAAYGPDGALLWRLGAGSRMTVISAYGSRALVQKAATGPGTEQPFQLVDLRSGQVLQTVPARSYPWLLLGSGS